jgi:hypothetical protein
MRIVVASARAGGAMLVLTAGALHLYLYFDFFHRVHVIGVLFVLNAAAGTVIGILILLSSHPVAAAAGVVYATATLGGFFLSVYHGLFGYVERLTGPWQETAGAVELAAIILLLPVVMVGMRSRRRRRWWQADREPAR